MTIATHPLSVLVVDDDLIVRTVHKRFLEKLQCEVFLAEDGSEALKALETPYGIIFMDMDMPHLNGVETTQKIRSQKNPNQHTPIIAVTSHDEAETLDRCLAAGMNDATEKPLSPEKIKTLLAKWVKSF